MTSAVTRSVSVLPCASGWLKSASSVLMILPSALLASSASASLTSTTMARALSNDTRARSSRSSELPERTTIFRRSGRMTLSRSFSSMTRLFLFAEDHRDDLLTRVRFGDLIEYRRDLFRPTENQEVPILHDGRAAAADGFEAILEVTGE